MAFFCGRIFSSIQESPGRITPELSDQRQPPLALELEVNHDRLPLVRSSDLVGRERIRMKKIALYCKCGAAWKGTVSEMGAWWILAQWHTMHQGDGHGACDARTVARNRAAAERAEELKANA